MFYHYYIYSFHLKCNELALHFADTCPPVSLPNGRANANRLPVNGRYPPGTAISFSCNYGYRLFTGGPGQASSTYCLDSGSWTFSPPYCDQSNKITILGLFSETVVSLKWLCILLSLILVCQIFP